MTRKTRTLLIVLAVVLLAAFFVITAYTAIGRPLEFGDVAVLFIDVSAWGDNAEEEFYHFVPSGINLDDLPSQNPADYAFAFVSIEVQNPHRWLNQYITQINRVDEDITLIWEPALSWDASEGVYRPHLIPLATVSQNWIRLGRVLIYRDGRTYEEMLEQLREIKATFYMQAALHRYTQVVYLHHAEILT